MFALVIAMLQAIYPYCLGEIFGYPIIELDLPDLDEQEVERLVLYAAAVILFEMFGWYLAEFAVMILGYWVIAESLYKILKWYKGHEKRKENVENMLEEDLKKILEHEEEPLGETAEKTNEELQELLERIVRQDGVEERKIIKGFSEYLMAYRWMGDAKKEDCIFWYSFYMADLLMDKCRDKEHISGSWHFRFMKNQILSASNETISEAYIMGILVGCLAKNVSGASQSVIGVILPKLQEELTQEKFLGIIWMLCVFLECVCYADERAFDTAVLLVNSSLISSGD
ncbi:hypothetical protein AALB64_15960 [Lachnospiraceae bacterium 45-P1]